MAVAKCGQSRPAEADWPPDHALIMIPFWEHPNGNPSEHSNPAKEDPNPDLQQTYINYITHIYTYQQG